MQIDLELVNLILNANFPSNFSDFHEEVIEINGKESPILIYSVSGSEAFDFSYITGASYLVLKHGYFLNSAIKLFKHRNHNLLEYSHFILNALTKELEIRKLSPITYLQQNPDLVNHNKKIALIEFQDRSNIEKDFYDFLIKTDRNPRDYLLYKINSETNECLEGFLEYIVCKKFISMGFYVENQVPWSYHGRPDFAAYSHPIFSKIKHYYSAINPMLIYKFCLLRIFNTQTLSFSDSISQNNSEYKLLIAEAKVNQQKSQILKYLGSKLHFPNQADLQIADYGFEIILDKRKKNSKYEGLINLSKDYMIEIDYPDTNKFLNENLKNEDEIWFSDYIKGLILYNFTVDEIKYLMNVNKLTKNAFTSGLAKLEIGDIFSIL